ncbi:MAG TPA: fasciclin domain-containing protein [Pseudolabrys sp.]|nr:fasciclin domain-containing protein [Pseudolabrys sp.]
MKRMLTTVLAGFAAATIAVSLGGMSPSFFKKMTKMVGGAAMYPSKNIVQNAIHSKDHTTLVAAVKAAGLVKTLESPGPFTVFAPTNEAFKKLPAGTVHTLLEPKNKGKLKNILTYHVVPGRLTTQDLRQKVKAGGGKAMLKTAEGDDLTVEEKGGHLWIIDGKGDKARITISNVMQSNGVIQVINKVMLPG